MQLAETDMEYAEESLRGEDELGIPSTESYPICVLPQEVVPLAVSNGVPSSSQELLKVAVTRCALL